MFGIVVNKSPVDQYTLVHFGAGVAARHYGIGFWPTLAAGFAWDYAIEPAAKSFQPTWFPYPSQDAPTHQAIDAVIPAVGWLVYDWLYKHKASPVRTGYENIFES